MKRGPTVLAVAAAALMWNAPVEAHHYVGHGAESATDGRAVYDENCGVCHGANLAGPAHPEDFGDRVPPRLDGAGHAGHHDDGFLARQIRRGSRDKYGRPVTEGMPAFAGILSDQEIAAVVAYIKSTWHTPMPNHRMDGRGPAMQGPRGQMPGGQMPMQDEGMPMPRHNH